MTVQIGHNFKHKGYDYSIVAVSDPIQFDPLDYGIEPLERCTVCYNGFWCDYQVSAERIMLKNLYINSKNDYYPKINNVGAKEDRKGTLWGHHLYENIDIFIEYTGKILIGKDFLDKYWLRTYGPEPWAYEDLEELIFDNSKLVKIVDYSEMAKNLRIELENSRTEEHPFFNESVMDEYFSTEVKDKAWWIK